MALNWRHVLHKATCYMYTYSWGLFVLQNKLSKFGGGDNSILLLSFAQQKSGQKFAAKIEQISASTSMSSKHLQWIAAFSVKKIECGTGRPDEFVKNLPKM
jgi:hypothetical protein